MEQIKQATYEIIDQLTELAEKLTPDEFTRPLPVLLDNSIGMHFRHIIEFYEVLMAGAQKKRINYDSRKHDPVLEQNRDLCLERLRGIRQAVDLDPGLDLALQGSYAREGDRIFSLSSNIKRELVYNIEHAIHHMAIIRIALRQEFPNIQVGAAFGYAYSTLKQIRK